ncbi:type I restriction enzyme, S subunit [Lachnospiraceae bacterium A10]|nr:type I restriction enzyme, S subunit [Lachnospiraceae bacterium A10]
MGKLIEITLSDYIDILTDYHSGGSYKTLKEKTKILHNPDYAVMVRTLNFESNDFINNLIYCDKDSYDFLEYSHIKENDVLMNKIANPGSVYIMPKVEYRATCAMNLFLLRFKGINQRYMYYVMKNSEQYIKNQAHGTTTKTITKDEVRNLKFYIHENKEERDRIAELLSSIDYKIDNNNKINLELESMAKTLFDYWFVQYEYQVPAGTYKSSGGKIRFLEEIGKDVPESWEIISLGELISEAAKSPVQVNEAREHHGSIPFFTSGNEIILFDKKFVDGFNIFLNTGGNADIKAYKGAAAYSTDTWCISAGEYSYYIYMYMLSIKECMDQLFFSGSGLQHLQKDAFKNQLIVKPDISVIREYNRIVEDVFEKISHNKIENQELIELKEYILPLLMNGQIEI